MVVHHTDTRVLRRDAMIQDTEHNNRDSRQARGGAAISKRHTSHHDRHIVLRLSWRWPPEDSCYIAHQVKTKAERYHK